VSAAAIGWPTASNIRRSTQVGACTPFVIDEMGTSRSSNRATARRTSAGSPRRAAATRRWRAGRAQAHDRHVEDAGLATGIRLGAKRQDRVDRHPLDRVVAAEVGADLVGAEAVDARGTGVWVVNTVAARTASSASSNVMPVVLTSSRIRSMPMKPA
jgi:hypothetical protein